MKSRMPNPPRLGLRRPDRTRPTVKLQLTGAVPAHPITADHLAQVTEWNGATNFRYGTCGPVSVANLAILTWKYLAGEDIAVSDAAIFDLYRRSGNPDFNPDTDAGDDGVDMTVMLAALVKGGITITHADNTTELVKPLCFAELSPESLEPIHATTAICGGLLLAWDLDVAQQDGSLWDYVAGSSPWGGHATCGGKYTSSSAARTADVSLVSWEAVYGTTDAFVAHQLSGAFAVVFQPLWDHPDFMAGVDRAALAADYTALTGRPFPAPAPVPPPAPADVDAAFGNDPKMVSWAKARHIGCNSYAAAQFRAWRAAKGYQ